MQLWVLTIFLIIFSRPAIPQLTPDQTFYNLVNIINQMDRVFGLYKNRPDFNAWLKLQNYHTKEATDNVYDFIIVGSGSAGSVIANRLSEIPQFKILLLEAGIPTTEVMRVPFFAPAMQYTEYNWGYYMEYQPNVCRGLKGYKMHWPRGRSLGGSSSINYMIYTRGNRIDFDRWSAAGNPGWSYDEVLPYYLKSERAKLKLNDARYHNTEGYLSVEDSYQSDLVQAFIRAGEQVGIPHGDHNSRNNLRVVSTIQANIQNGRRHDVARAFLWPVRDRPNLDIVTSAFVTKVLIDPESKEAYGVEYQRKDQTYQVRASREVILSAGAFNSPQLLMLSGIGPAEHLEDLGIPLLQDLPVGRNLHDHICFPGLAFTVNETVAVTRFKLINATSIASYLKSGTGPLTSLGGAEGIAYVKTEVSDHPENYPDIELLFIGASLSADHGLVTRLGLRIRDDVFNPLFYDLRDTPTWTVFPMLVHPKSTGYMKLRSSNPYDYPLFYGNYFTDPNNQDIKTIIASIRIVQELSATPAFQRYGSRINPRPTPGCEHFQFDSDEYWECSIRSLAVTLHHQVGTAKMGPADDPTSVVNPQLQVYGVSRLRVADTSIIPFALTAHMNAPAIMVGEKAADLIKDLWLQEL